MMYASSLLDYLSVLEQRLFSEGLYSLGAKMETRQLLGYMDAVYGESGIKSETLAVIAEGESDGQLSLFLSHTYSVSLCPFLLGATFCVHSTRSTLTLIMLI